MGKWEVIVELESPEGNVLLLGKALENNRWHFMLRTDEYHLEETPYEDNTDLIISENQLIGDWCQAVRLISKYPWKKMSPAKIHPLFKVFLWNKFNYDKEYEDCSVRWYTRCFIPEEDENLDYVTHK